MNVQEVLEGSLKPVFVAYFPEFVNKFGDDPDMQNWIMREYAEQLVNLRITSDQLRFGTKKCKTLSFRPNPYQFAQLCKPSADDLGLPSADDAFNEIIRRWGRFKGKDFTFSHRVVELTSERVGFKIYRMKEPEARKLFGLEYAYWVSMACDDNLPEPRKALNYVTPKIIPIDTYLANGHVPKVPDAFNDRLAELGCKLKRGALK